MIKDKAMATLLSECAVDDMFLVGKLLTGISNEDIAWRVIEKVECIDGLRITLHAYWFDVFIISKVVTVAPGTNELIWGVTKT